MSDPRFVPGDRIEIVCSESGWCFADATIRETHPTGYRIAIDGYTREIDVPARWAMPVGTHAAYHARNNGDQ